MVRKRRFGRFGRFGRNRRISRGTWFPTNGTFWLADEGGEEYWDASITDFVFPTPSAKWEGPRVAVYPLTPDYTQTAIGIQAEQINARPSLRDFTEGQDWLLKSLIGNLFIHVPQTLGSLNWNESSYWPMLRVGAGFFVARALDSDQASPDLTSDEIDPLGGKNIQNSWIWRRTWMFDSPNAAYELNVGSTVETLSTGLTTANWTLPEKNGPFFQTKSRRRIKREERLWFAIATQGMARAAGDGDVSGDPEQQPFAAFNLDYRIFGKMVKGRTSATF